MPRVSVVIPVRNLERTLPAALASIQSQHFDDFEIIIVNHRSTDGTAEIIESAANRDSRIRHCQSGGTFVEAANLAWQKSRGELIARMDGDDVAAPERLAAQVSFLDENPELAACGSLVNIVKRAPDGSPCPPDDGYRRYGDWINSVTTPEAIETERFVDSPIPNPTSMIRRDVLVETDGYADPEWAEDYDFWLSLIEKGYRIGKVPQILLDWYDSDERSTRTIARYELTQFQRAKAHYLSRIPAVKEKGVVICGAGPVGKEFSRLLRERDVPLHAFIEVNKRQIGNTIGGLPVFNAAKLSAFSDSVIALSAVGQEGARAKVRQLAAESGFTEGINFYCVA